MATAETIGMSIGIAVLSVLLVIVLAYVWLGVVNSVGEGCDSGGRGIDLTACHGHCRDASLPRGAAGGSMSDLRPYECDADD